jgi:hypothetical protein
MNSRVLLMVAILAATGIAGCTSDSGDTSDGAIRVVGRPTDGTVDPLTLEATLSADEYKWNLGDGRPRLAGKEVSHIYGVANGEFRIELTTVTGGESTVHAPLTITLGTGLNEAPAMLLEMEWNWVQVGEEVTFAVTGTDAENDPILAQWFCQRKTDIGIPSDGGHAAPPGGLSFGTGSTSSVPFVVLNGTNVPAGSQSVSGDMCENMATTAYSEDTAAIRGAFAQRGIYELTVLAKDPGHPGVSGLTTVYVTDEPREQGPQSEQFVGTIQAGAPAAADAPTAEADAQDHIVAHEFEIKYKILNIKASLANDGGSGIPVDIKYALFKGSTEKVGETADSLDKGAGYLSPGTWTAFIYLRQGSDVEYTFDVEFEYETNPAALFESPH